MKFITQSRIYLIIAGVVLLLLAAVFFWGRSSKQGITVKKRKLPNSGSGIPTNGGAVWSPDGDVEKLRGAMFGSGTGNWWDVRSYGTDEESIYNALEGRTNDQKTAIYNEYNRRYKTDLKVDFRDELSGASLERALAYIQFV